jgi:hypothetical protein
MAMMLRCRACGRDVPLSEFCYSSAAIICELCTRCRQCRAADNLLAVLGGEHERRLVPPRLLDLLGG